jgi:hypothetical protein
MRASVVVADVFAQDALGVALAEEQDVVEACGALGGERRHLTPRPRSRARKRAS